MRVQEASTRNTPNKINQLQNNRGQFMEEQILIRAITKPRKPLPTSPINIFDLGTNDDTQIDDLDENTNIKELSKMEHHKSKGMWFIKKKQLSG